MFDEETIFFGKEQLLGNIRVDRGKVGIMRPIGN